MVLGICSTIILQSYWSERGGEIVCHHILCERNTSSSPHTLPNIPSDFPDVPLKILYPIR